MRREWLVKFPYDEDRVSYLLVRLCQDEPDSSPRPWSSYRPYRQLRYAPLWSHQSGDNPDARVCDAVRRHLTP